MIRTVGNALNSRDEIGNLIWPNPPNRECIIIIGALEIRSIPAATAFAVEAHGGEVMPAPTLDLAVFGVPILRMASEPARRLVDPLLVACELLPLEGRVETFLAHFSATNFPAREASIVSLMAQRTMLR